MPEVVLHRVENVFDDRHTVSYLVLGLLAVLRRARPVLSGCRPSESAPPARGRERDRDEGHPVVMGALGVVGLSRAMMAHRPVVATKRERAFDLRSQRRETPHPVLVPAPRELSR